MRHREKDTPQGLMPTTSPLAQGPSCSPYGPPLLSLAGHTHDPGVLWVFGSSGSLGGQGSRQLVATTGPLLADGSFLDKVEGQVERLLKLVSPVKGGKNKGGKEKSSITQPGP